MRTCFKFWAASNNSNIILNFDFKIINLIGLNIDIVLINNIENEKDLLFHIG